MKKVVWWVREMVFPRRCPVCDKPVKPAGRYICHSCEGKLKYVAGEYCMKCGKPLSEKQEYCEDCKKRKHRYIRGKSLYEYKSVSSAIYRFKYGKRREYAEFFGKEMAEHFRELVDCWKPEGLVPVPIHKSRKQQRGYNQAQLLAEEMGKRLGIPVYNDLLMRQKKTIPQKELKAAERQNNLKKSFKIGRNDVKLSTIIIIDDIYTTGATVDSMAEVLEQMGIKNIYVLTLAIGGGT